MPDDQVKIDVNVQGQAGVDQLTKSVTVLKYEVKTLAKEFAETGGDFNKYEEEMEQLTSEIKRQEKALESLTEAMEEQGEKLTRSAENTRDATRKTSQGILDLSRAGQDFAQGGFSAVINNLEGVGRAIGNFKEVGIGDIAAALLSPTGLAAGLMAVGTVAFTSWPLIKKWYDDLKEESEKAGGHFDTMQDKLKAVAKQIEEMKANKYPDPKDAEEYNQLLGKQVDIEKEISAQKKSQSDYQTLMERSTKAQMEQEASGETARRKKELDKIPREQMAGVRRDVITGLTQQNMIPQMEKERADIAAALQNPANALKFTQGQRSSMERRWSDLGIQIPAARAGVQDKAQEIMAGLKGGDRAGLEGVLRMLPTDSESFRNLQKLSGQGMAAAAVEERDQRFRNIGGILGDFGRHVDQKTSLEAKKKLDEKREKDKKLVDQLNEQGITNEIAAAKEKEDDEKKAKHEKDMAVKKAKHEKDMAEHARKTAESKAKQFREESGRDFERFKDLPAEVGFPGLDVVAAKYAATGPAQRPAARRFLIGQAARALRIQHNVMEMPDEEVQQHAQQYPEFLEQRFQGQKARAATVIQAQGGNVGEQARTEGLSREAYLSGVAANKAMLEYAERTNKNLMDLARQNMQTANTLQRLNRKTTSPTDGTGSGPN